MSACKWALSLILVLLERSSYTDQQVSIIAFIMMYSDYDMQLHEYVIYILEEIEHVFGEDDYGYTTTESIVFEWYDNQRYHGYVE